MLADGLGQMTFAQSGRSDEQNIFSLANELTCGLITKLLAFDRAIKVPLKIFQRFGVAEAGQFLPSLDRALLAHVEFVLKDQLQKLSMRQLVRLGFLQSQFQAG